MTTGPPSFAAFVDQHQSGLLKFAMTLTGDPSGAEDLVGVVISRAFERWARISAMDRPLGYVRRMVTNEYLETQRHRKRWTRLRSRLAAPEQVLDQTGEVDGREVMIRLLNRLPPRQRSVIVLRYYLDRCRELCI